MSLEHLLSLGKSLPTKAGKLGASLLLSIALAGSCGKPFQGNVSSPPDDSVEYPGDGQPSENEPSAPLRIAYVMNDGETDKLVIADEEGSILQTYSFSWRLPTYSAPCWSPDGRSILLNREGTLQSFDLASGELQPLLQSADWRYGGTRRFAPGLALVANQIVDGEESPSEIFTYRESELERITHDSDEDYSPSWAADGRLAYVSSAAGLALGSSVYVYDGTHHTEVPLSVPFIQQLLWSPDGEQLAFVGQEGMTTGLYTYSPATGQELLANLDVRKMQWSPNGMYIILDDGVLTVPHHLYRFDVEERQLTRLLPDSNASSPAVHPDSEQVLFQQAGNLYKMRWDETEVQPLTFYEYPAMAFPAEWEGYCR